MCGTRSKEISTVCTQRRSATRRQESSKHERRKIRVPLRVEGRTMGLHGNGS